MVWVPTPRVEVEKVAVSPAAVDVTARIVLAACSEGDTLRTNLVVLRRFGKYEPVDSIALRRKIAHRLLDAERYIV